MSTLTPNSHIIKAVQNHLDTGIPIDSYNLTPQEVQRIEAVFHLYKAWKQNMLIDKRAFLQYVHNRRTQDIPSDLYLFDYIKQHTHDILLSKPDLLALQQQAVIEGFQAARQNGESATLLKAADKLEKLREAMPEEAEQIHSDLDDFYTTDVQKIAPDFIPVDSAARRKLIAKYGGKPDTNTQQVEDKIAALLSLVTTVPEE